MSADSLMGHDEFNGGLHIMYIAAEEPRTKCPAPFWASRKHCCKKQANSHPWGIKQLHGSYPWPRLHLFHYQEMEENCNLS